MAERWRRELERFRRVPAPLEDIERRARLGPRSSASDDTPASGRRRLVTIAAGLALFAFAASVYVIPAIREGGGAATGDGTPTDAVAAIDPDRVCDVPAFDPSVALLVGNETTAYPKSVLEGGGQDVSSMTGPAADELRAYVGSSAGRNAPSDGWRVIASSFDAVTFAAPPGFGVGDWWVVGFARRDGRWDRVEEEIVDQEQTPAERGRGLSLEWVGDVVVSGGRWTSTLTLVNGRSGPWSEDRDLYWGIAHVFDASTGDEVPSGSPFAEGSTERVPVEAGAAMALPLALGASLRGLSAGTYDVVACVPQLALASPVGTLTVMDDPVTSGVRVLTYPSNGISMGALGSGTLGVRNGCLALTGGGGDPYLVLPDGYEMVKRDGVSTLISPTGEIVGALGDAVSFGGGYVSMSKSADAITGGVPETCSEGDAFVSGGLAG